MLKIQLSITGINYILKHIQIEDGYFKLYKYVCNIAIYFDCILI